MTAAPVPAPSATMKAILRSLRCASRQGSRFIRGISVEAPQCEATGGEQCRGITLYGLRLGARGQSHLAEWIALLSGNSDAARNDVGNPRNVCAAAADQDLLRLLASGARGEVELQRPAHLLRHVVDEGIEHLGLEIARQPALFLGAASLFHGKPIGAHDLLSELLATESEITR